MDEKETALEAIRKKLLGKKLSYKEIYDIMDEISHNRLGDILTTYFAASGYAKGFSDEELYYLTKAMVETGETLHFNGIIADKHSIGGVPGTRTTLIVVPLIAAAGFTIPKSSSRAITTPDGTADDMEVLAKVEFSEKEIYKIVKKTGGCITWGGSFHIAPADDILIHVEHPLEFESYDKIVVSIMSKKIAYGSNHIVIDVPFGPSLKVHHRSDARVLEQKFKYIARRFNVKVYVYIHEMHEPAGRGVGPVLECRESLRVLEQLPDRPMDLEQHALTLSGLLLDLCLRDCPVNIQKQARKHFKNGYEWAQQLLSSGKALEKMQEIIDAQGGNPQVTSAKLTERLGMQFEKVKAKKSGIIHEINSKNSTSIAKILGAPMQKGAGLYYDKKVGEKVEKGDTLYTMYSETLYNLKEAEESLDNFPVMEIK